MQIITKNELMNNQRIIEEIKNGKTFIFKTETVYGISANAYCEKAVQKVYKAKGRDFNKPCIVLINSYQMLKEIVCDITPLEQKIMNKFWPGALTIVFKRKSNSKLALLCSAGRDMIGVRMTDSLIGKYIIDKLNLPIISTSANKSGEVTSDDKDTIINTFKEEIDYFILEDDVTCEIPSTIIEVKDNKIIILREGKISKEALDNLE